VNLRDVILYSYRAARRETIEARSSQQRNTLRAAALVRALADELHTQCAAHRPAAEVRCFTRADRESRSALGLDEMLHDICVCEVDAVQTLRHRIDLRCVKGALWQVQVEFEHDVRATMAAFNKLVLGSAENKLLLCPLNSDPDGLAEVLSPLAASCSGTIHLGFVPHPSTWEQQCEQVSACCLGAGEWRRL
jgi:hypothetical protein